MIVAVMFQSESSLSDTSVDTSSSSFSESSLSFDSTISISSFAINVMGHLVHVL